MSTKSLILQRGITYGPVRSRRLGMSLGLNILPMTYKLCTLNCVYCQYGWTSVCNVDVHDRFGDLPTPDNFEKALEAALYKQREIDNITFSGNGEPTLHPHFGELVDIAKMMRNKYSPKAKLGVLSNSSMLSSENVRRALSKLDFRIMKLDAGNLETFIRINQPYRDVNYEEILKGLKSLEGVTLQTMFVDGAIHNTDKRDLDEWMQRIVEIQPLKLQIYSLHRPPAEPSLSEVPEEELSKIARQIEKMIEIPIEVVVARTPYS